MHREVRQQGLGRRQRRRAEGDTLTVYAKRPGSQLTLLTGNKLHFQSVRAVDIERFVAEFPPEPWISSALREATGLQCVDRTISYLPKWNDKNEVVELEVVKDAWTVFWTPEKSMRLASDFSIRNAPRRHFSAFSEAWDPTPLKGATAFVREFA